MHAQRNLKLLEGEVGRAVECSEVQEAVNVVPGHVGMQCLDRSFQLLAGLGFVSWGSGSWSRVWLGLRVLV
jgi:hypothetical protein